MGIMLLSGLSLDFPGKAWLRVAMLDNPYHFFCLTWAGGWVDSLFTASMVKTKQNRPTITLCRYACALLLQEYIIFKCFTFTYHYKCYE